MELRRATWKDQTDTMELGFLPDGSAPFISLENAVEDGPGLTADVILTGGEDGETFFLYVQIYAADGELAEGWTREFPDLPSARRVAGFLSSPLSRADLSLLSFSRGY